MIWKQNVSKFRVLKGRFRRAVAAALAAGMLMPSFMVNAAPVTSGDMQDLITGGNAGNEGVDDDPVAVEDGAAVVDGPAVFSAPARAAGAAASGMKADLGTGTGTQRETRIGDASYLENDKYLSDPTGERNGQNTYNLYLEQGVVDTTDPPPEYVVNEAPVKRNFILVLDQSSSMAHDDIIAKMNNGSKAFFEAMQKTNARILQNCRDGAYSDVDPKASNIEQLAQEHMLYVSHIIGFNRKVYERWHSSQAAAGGTLVNSSSIVNDLYNVTKLRNDLDEPNADMDYCTQTWKAMKRVKELVAQAPVKEDVCVILITDGGPNSDIPNYEGMDWGWCDTPAIQQSFGYAREIKDMGASIESVYVAEHNTPSSVYKALASGSVDDIAHQSAYPYWFVSFLSSDYPKNGKTLKIPTGDSGAASKIYTYEDGVPNRFGVHTWVVDDWSQLAMQLTSVPPATQNTASKTAVTGYANAGSAVVDTLTQPFELDGYGRVRVYKVPRIPANLDASGKPADMAANGVVSSFRWGEEIVGSGENASSEWIDITDEVSLSVSGRTVRVSGFDYEANALTNYSKNLGSRWSKDETAAQREARKVYRPGDYGYKLVMKIPIHALSSFGGNGITTNDDNGTRFLPGSPTGPEGERLPEWPKNASLNPSGKEEVTKYPVPKVDLKIGYNVVSDDVIIYAPQTAKLKNLVTDENLSLFYQDAAYEQRKLDYDNALAEYNAADEQRQAFDVEFNKKSSPSDADTARMRDLEQKSKEASDKLADATDALAEVYAYIPNGINNQFVDITYQLKDPDGTVVGTMQVPHGTAYRNGNLKWSFTGGDNARVNKSGVYQVQATISPVNTTKSPDGYVHTILDNAETQAAYPYASTQYSSTGSTAAGSQSAKTITKDAKALIFTLKVTVQDTRLMPRQTLDFYQGSENLKTTDNPHAVSFEWVCTDGKTASETANEPGEGANAGNYIGGYPMMVSSVSAQARADGKVVSIGGTDACGQEDSYVPVNASIVRSCGLLDKDATESDRFRQTPVIMSDTDRLYGTKSSVQWVHVCDYENDCATDEFKDAQKYNSSAANVGKVRYLIHVQANPNPKVEKSTSTPAIGKGEDIKWQITVSNDSAEENPNERASDNMLIDALPWVGDTDRMDPVTGNEGSKFHGDLKYTGMSIDFSKAPNALSVLKTGSIKYTVDPAVRGADMQQLYNNAGFGNVAWKNASFKVSGTNVAVTVPSNAKGIRVDTLLLFGERYVINLKANMVSRSQQQKGDYYHNRAEVYNHNTGRFSEVVTTLVSSKYISGTIWEDEDGNGLISAGEQKYANIPVSLYQPYNPLNGGQPDAVINGVQLSRVWSNETEQWVMPTVTGDDGTYMFDDLQTGTYYIVADHIPEEHAATKKNAGTDTSSRALDSKCDTNWVGDEADRMLWIRKVYVGNASVRYQNFGLKPVVGNLRVYKSLDEIYYPLGMTDEEKADYQLIFTFKLTHTATGRVYRQTVRLTPENFDSGDCYCDFVHIPLGAYVLEEQTEAQYQVKKMSGSGISYNSSRKQATFTLTEKTPDRTVRVENTLRADPPGGDENGMKNLLKVRIPVKLELKYVGQDPIVSKTLTKYTFTRDDFDPKRGGDMIVTYDDGTQISLSKGTLKFGDVQLEPPFVTNLQNSGDRKVQITGYYSENGRTVTDSFPVQVDLKPVHKFVLIFDANSGYFDDGNTENAVNFVYDDNAKCNVVTKGTYKDVPNGRLTAPVAGYVFAGWNTAYDGTGVNYDNQQALDAIGKDPTVSSLKLYARWRLKVNFDATGGAKLAGGASADEKAIAGQRKGSILWDLNRKLDSTALVGSKSMYNFIHWNTRANAKGTILKNYGRVTKEVTFYAVYYKGTFAYTGAEQFFTTPVDGIYAFELWGAPGGGSIGGHGAYVKCYIEMKGGRKVHVFVGGSGEPLREGVQGQTGGWNGGGYIITCEAGPHASSGGGMTHISDTSNLAVASKDPNKAGSWNPAGVLAVAGGGGGKGNENYGTAQSVTHANGVNQKRVLTDGRVTGETYDSWWKIGNKRVMGCGRACYNSSSGGGGYYGGNSSAQVDATNAATSTPGGHCGAGGGGGTSYIAPAGYAAPGHSDDYVVYPGGDVRKPAKPNGNSTPGGYVLVTLVQDYTGM